MNSLTNTEMTNVVRNAYDELPYDERVRIKKIANNLILKMKAKYGKDTVFGFDSALEVLACLGIAINDNRLRLIK